METYFENYKRWLNEERLTDAERFELAQIRNDDNEIRMRFSSYLSLDRKSVV